jgi:putative heme-binding domain-containing protein
VKPVSLSRRLAFAAALVASLVTRHPSLAAAPEDELALGVRTTPPLSPAEQTAKFKLPPGFEIQLVATEPDINKPFNLAFDAAGRLWVTTSIEYPYAAPTNRVGRDRLMIFEDFGPDGRARKITQFADGLNIPIGVYPFRSARSPGFSRNAATPAGQRGIPPEGGTTNETWKAIVWSIPHIWLMEDTDGDGKADKREPLYGPFDYTRDTHGNQASFRRGFDGWLYATHGYNNDSHVTARDGSRVDLNSGNTYRMRLDGSRIEQHTHGQVNPYGLAWDARGNLYSSDCHSAPIYQLLAGGWYPSFGKPHDGLGFAPVMLEHAHGSTAIDGAFYYSDDLWPAEYQDTFMIGNVMTSRLNRDKITFIGSTPKATEQPDFLTTTDPWFRPVDNILGPDGALYIADFYNRIIGHYEVPLTHPGRDRERGRIWRVVYTGGQASSLPGAAGVSPASPTATGQAGKPALRPAALPNDLDGLIAELGSPNLTRRLLAMAEIEDRFGTNSLQAVDRLLSQQGYPTMADVSTLPKFGKAGPSQPNAVIAALWLRNRLVRPGSEEGQIQPLHSGHFQENAPAIRTHVQRIYAERGFNGDMPRSDRGYSLWALTNDPDALVRRCAAEALGNWPAFDHLRPLLDVLAKADPADTHLVYVLRKSLRDHLKVPALAEQVLAKNDWSAADQRAFADVAVAVQTPQAATLLLRQLSTLPEDGSPSVGDALRHAARFAPEGELTGLVEFTRTRFADRTEFQLALFKSVDQGLQQRGVQPPAPVRSWGAELVGRLLATAAGSSWANTPVDAAPTENPWDFQERRRADGKTLRVLSSIPKGEGLTGTLRSPVFTAGPTLSFWLCGHDGYPERPAQKRNAVRLREAKSGAVLLEAAPPRNDVAQQIVWNTGAFQGGPVQLEVTDADTGDAYAWLAFGDIEGGPALPAVSPRALAERTTGAAELAARLGLQEVAPQLQELARQPGDPDARAAAAKGLAALNATEAIATLGPLLGDGSQPLSARERFGITLAELNSAAGRAPVLAALKGVPYRVQQRWAVPLCATKDGSDAFLQAVEKGDASPRILQMAGARGRIQRAGPPDWQARLEKLTKDLQPMDEARGNLITARMNGFNTASVNLAEGQRLFEVNCGICHQLDGKGALVGPQLTGIGVRGVERLCEDILDPNRNVDHAFATTTLTLKDGEAVSGLFRREEGELLVLANATGQEFTVPKQDVKERAESPLSPMPDNFGEILSEPDFNHLLAFLLSKR